MEENKAVITQKRKILHYLESALLVIWGVTFLLFPLVFFTFTSEAFVLAKEILVAGAVFLSLLVWAAKILIEGKVKFRRTPFDLPLFLFFLALIVSCLFSVSKIDSFLAFFPILFSILSYFIIVNMPKKANSFSFLLWSIIVGIGIGGIVNVFYYLKMYILPFKQTYFQGFNTFGSLLEQAVAMLAAILIVVMLVLPKLKGKIQKDAYGYVIAIIVLVAGLAVTTLQLFTTQKPILLPFDTGFQTTFATISQDTGRIAQGFLFGSGFGTFANDFTRFKQATFNDNPTLWFLTFSQSSSFILELLATTGIIGVLTFLFLLFRVVGKIPEKVKNPLVTALFWLILASFLLPFSFITVTLFFFLLALFATFQAHLSPQRFFDVEFKFVALRKGMITVEAVGENNEREYTRLMPIVMTVVFLAFVGIVGTYTVKYVLSDIFFQSSLIAASQNNGTTTYNKEVAAIGIFPYRSVYYRVFAQTNLALANSLSTTAQGKTSNLDAQTQSTIYGLIQQSINAGRTATSLSPQGVVNWQTLGNIYRSLIGFGQNAENFAIVALQQAVLLDPTNPQEYIALGGIYYQLAQYDNASRMFQTAINLKQDFPNSYYNLGHTFEQQGNLQQALSQYEIVKTLVSNDPPNLKKISDEIDVLKKKIGSQANAANSNLAPSTTSTTPLGINQPQTQLPPQNPPVKIPAPVVSATPTPETSPTPTPALSPAL